MDHFSAALRAARRSINLRGAAHAVREAFAGPFQRLPPIAGDLSVDQLERQRRALILRLILSFVLVSLIFIAIPLSVLRAQPVSVYGVFLVLILASILGLLANQRGYTTAAASVFLASAFALTVVYAATQRAGGLAATINYANLGVFLLIAGLTAPSALLWVTTAVAALLTAGGLIFFPFAPLFPSQAVGVTGHGLAPELISFQLLTALLAQVYVSSTRASLRASLRAYQQERELTALKDQFLIDANHELRSPIMALSSNVQLLAKLGERASPEDRERMLGRAVRAATRLQQFLHNVLDAGALESGTPRVHLAPVELGPLVQDMLATFDPAEIGEPELAEHTPFSRIVHLQVPPALVVQADPSRLRQVLLNLVANAVKYSAPGTPLTITATRMTPRQPKGHGQHQVSGAGDVVQVGVTDHGLGVPPEDAPKLFQRFVRLPRDIAGPVRGTGVGLYLTRSLVEAMGGRVWVESAGIPGEGSTFHFTLPALTKGDVPAMGATTTPPAHHLQPPV
jgi:signal transduction histidine kinase